MTTQANGCPDGDPNGTPMSSGCDDIRDSDRWWPISAIGDGDRPEAVRQAETGAKAWRATVHAQRMAPPDHADFYSQAGDVVATLAALTGWAEAVAWQVAHYGDNRPVYDDSGVVDLWERLDAAAMDLNELAAQLRMVDRIANTFWSRIGHIGVDTPADEQVPAEVTR